MPTRLPHCRHFMLAAVLCGCAASAWSAGHAVSVSLHSSASVARPAVVLGEVADVTGADQAQVQRLRTLPLGRLGAGAPVVSLARHTIAGWVCARRGLCGGEVVWSGAPQVEIRETVQAVGSADLAEVAKKELERALAPLGAELSAEAATGPGSVQLPAGPAVFTARPLPPGTAPARRMSVWVDASVEGRFVRTVAVQFKVSARVAGWVARDEIAAGARVAADAFVPAQVDLAETPGVEPRRRADTFTHAAEILVARRTLRPGQPLTAANSGPAPLVARGELALLRVKSTPIELESRVEVMQDGFLGQTVRVKATNAAGTMLATVAGAGLLEARN
jgi:flagella basal body P-ring formation protein FlgA